MLLTFILVTSGLLAVGGLTWFVKHRLDKKEKEAVERKRQLREIAEERAANIAFLIAQHTRSTPIATPDYISTNRSGAVGTRPKPNKIDSVSSSRPSSNDEVILPRSGVCDSDSSYSSLSNDTYSSYSSSSSDSYSSFDSGGGSSDGGGSSSDW